MILGAHVSIAGGIEFSVNNALDIGCQSFQIFTKNQRQWKAPPIPDESVERFREGLKKFDLGPVISHDSYLINLANPEKEKFERSIEAFSDEMTRCLVLGIELLVMHPGSHLGKGVQEGISRFNEGLGNSMSIVEKKYGELPTVLLETTSGMGTNLGSSFDHLSEMIQDSPFKDKLGVCFDTCHVFSAGYDIRDPDTYERTMEEFDSIIGPNRLKTVHLNDSKFSLGSKKDRHENIGDGEIGTEAFSLLIKDARFRDIPGILETPGGPERYVKDLQVLGAFSS